MKRFLSAIIVISVLGVTGCFEKIPVKELSIAKSAIGKAESVKSDYYAKEEYSQAKELLLAAHDNIKNEEYEKAKQNAIEARKKAEEAYRKALPLLAKDTLDVASQSINAADEVHAAVLAKDEYAKAIELFNQAKRYYDNKDYIATYSTALDADVYAKNARNTALNQKETLADAIKEVNVVIAQAESYGASMFASEKLALAREHVQIARNAYEEAQLKKGFSAIEVAKINADDAYFTSLKSTAAQKIEEAQTTITTAKESEMAKSASLNIKAAEETLAQSKKLFADAKYKESIVAATQAIHIAKEVLAQKPIALAPAIEQPKEETKKQEVQPIDMHKKNGKESEPTIQKKVEEETDYIIYKVKYNPSRRDCLWRIAEKFYKDGTKWKIIFEANKEQVKNPHLIYPGWALKIPKNATKISRPAHAQGAHSDTKKDEQAITTELRIKTE